MRTAVYINDYKTQVNINDNFFLESDNGAEFPCAAEYIVLSRGKDEMILFNQKTNAYFGGLYSQLYFIKGKIRLNGIKVRYFAYYFSSYNKNNLLEVRSSREKDLGKYNWCVKHCIGDTTKTVDQLAELAKQVKAAYIEKQKQKINKLKKIYKRL